MFQGVVFSILAGLLISFQNIFNARLSERVGMWETNVFIHITGFFVASTLLLISVRKVDYSGISHVRAVYLLGGVAGAFIIFSVAKAISHIGVSYAITILIVTQLISGFFINVFGVLGEEIVKVSLMKIIGLILMIGGLLVFQFG